MPSDCNGVSCFQQIFEKKLRIHLWSSGVFTFLWTSLAAFWLPIFLSAEPSRTILSIDRSEPRFERHAEGKITKTLKNDKNFGGFVNFLLNQIQNYLVQIKKMKGGIFSLQLKKKITSAKRLKTMLDLKMYPLSLIWLEP